MVKIIYEEQSGAKAANLKGSMPSLDKLAQKEEAAKVPLSLAKASAEYFKMLLKREVCYQVMLRNLIDEYVKHCSKQQTE